MDDYEKLEKIGEGNVTSNNFHVIIVQYPG